MFNPAEAPRVAPPTEIPALAKIAQELVVAVPPVFRPAALRTLRWVCVGVEDELEGEAAIRLARACSAAGFSAGWSVEIPWSAEQQQIAVHRFAIGAETLQAVTKDICLGSCYVLAEANGRFAVASDGDLYWMLAGSDDFVRSALGRSVTEQAAAFGKVVDAYNKGGSLAAKRLTAVRSAVTAVIGA